MRPLGVVVVDVGVEHALEVTAVEDQQPVEALRADGSDEALRDRVRLRRPYRCLHDPDSPAAEDLVEGAAVLAVPVADQEAHALVDEVEARLRACWVTHAPVGFVVQPPSQTRRLPWAMKKSA